MHPSGTAHQERGVETPTAESAESEPLAVEIRHCESVEDYAACVRLQSATWGADYRDVVTASLLKVSRHVGGVVGGAFLETGEIVGFVFGLTGIRSGRLVHWSHMLAVSEGYRDRGVGRRLKRFQWEALRGLGVESAYWTFDPLVARNAHLNLNRLSATLEEYVPDMYADTGSDLHAFGTDRLLVSWRLSGDTIRGDPPVASGGSAPVVNTDGAGAPSREPLEADVARIRIAIPAEIGGLVVTDVAGLKAWRASTRAAFQAYLGRGYRPRGFERGPERCWYVLENGAEPR